jgi:hypothetical protein
MRPVDVQENFTPTLERVTAMRKFSDDMRKAGVLLLAEGLHPSSKATRLKVSNGKRVFTDGPFLEDKEMIARFWMIQVKSREEALEWASRCHSRRVGSWKFGRYLRTPTFCLSFATETRAPSRQAHGCRTVSRRER